MVQLRDFTINRVLLTFLVLISVGYAQGPMPEWFKNRINSEVNRVYEKKSFKPHKDRWSKKEFKLIELNKIWIDGEKRGYEYLDHNQRQKYRLKFENGRIWDSYGNEFDTKGLREGGAQFVMDKNGVIYASRKWKRGKFEHHSLVSGEPVVCAGKMIVHNGRLKVIDDMSAQYKAISYEGLTRVITVLKSKGVWNDSVKVMYYKDFR